MSSTDTTVAARQPLSIRQRFDRQLGRVTMYRLVVLALAVLVVLAFALSAAGILPYAPQDLALSLLVLLGAAYLSNRLYAVLFAVHPHSESTIITALLLFFLLWPSSEPLELLALALAAGFASASKYLLAFRGRHIVNPAAIGVVFVTVLGLTGGVWWIATASMLPAVAVLGFLVAYRTRRLPMVGLFLAIAAGLIISFRLGAGDDIRAALEYAFVSTPMVFFAGFMLTEPLTLPPLFRQQLAVAAGVAVLFALPNLVTDRGGQRSRAFPGARAGPGQRGRVPARPTARHRADPAREAVRWGRPRRSSSSPPTNRSPSGRVSTWR